VFDGEIGEHHFYTQVQHVVFSNQLPNVLCVGDSVDSKIGRSLTLRFVVQLYSPLNIL